MSETKRVVRPGKTSDGEGTLIVRDPVTGQPIPDSGVTVDLDAPKGAGTYWRRRLAQGDVVEVVEEKKSKPKAQRRRTEEG